MHAKRPAHRSKNKLVEIMAMDEISVYELEERTGIPESTLRRIIYDGQEPTLRQAWCICFVVKRRLHEIFDELYWDCKGF